MKSWGILWVENPAVELRATAMVCRKTAVSKKFPSSIKLVDHNSRRQALEVPFAKS